MSAPAIGIIACGTFYNAVLYTSTTPGRSPILTKALKAGALAKSNWRISTLPRILLERGLIQLVPIVEFERCLVEIWMSPLSRHQYRIGIVY
jgi:hypothetical protein